MSRGRIGERSKGLEGRGRAGNHATASCARETGDEYLPLYHSLAYSWVKVTELVSFPIKPPTARFAKVQKFLKYAFSWEAASFPLFCLSRKDFMKL